jgi:hypothetical protein
LLGGVTGTVGNPWVVVGGTCGVEAVVGGGAECVVVGDGAEWVVVAGGAECVVVVAGGAECVVVAGGAECVVVAGGGGGVVEVVLNVVCVTGPAGVGTVRVVIEIVSPGAGFSVRVTTGPAVVVVGVVVDGDRCVAAGDVAVLLVLVPGADGVVDVEACPGRRA